MTPSQTKSLASSSPAATDSGAERGEPWIAEGIQAGVLGAAVVAVFFLVVDVLAGAPLRTPAALGSALFLGEPLAEGASPTPVLVAGYTAVHGAAFVAVGLMGAFGVAVARDRLGRRPGVVLFVLLFGAMEIFFLLFAETFAPGLTAQFGLGNVAAANLLAAGAMAAFVLRRA